MRSDDLERYLHDQIPLSAAMGVTVSCATFDTIVMTAPLAPNINHKRTAFGGSLSTLAILAAWSLVHLRLLKEQADSEVVIQSNQMHYDKPVTGPFAARAVLAAPEDWSLFVRTLRRRSLARIGIRSELLVEEDLVGRLEERFVAFLRQS